MEKRLSSCLSYQLLVTFLVTTVSSPDRDCSEFSARKEPPSSWVSGSDSDLFTDGDYVIIVVI